MQKHIAEIYFSQLRGRRIIDSKGHTFGKVKDIVTSWSGGLPIITGILYSEELDKLISADMVQNWNGKQVILAEPSENIKTIQISHQELFVGKWLLDNQVIDFKGYKVVRVNDILLSCDEQNEKQRLSIIAADVGIRGLLRRIGLEFLAGSLEKKYISWQHITPLEKRTGSLKLKLDKDHLKKLHPVDIADLLEDMDYDSRNVFFKALGAEQAAEAIGKLKENTQVEIVTRMDKEQSAQLLEDLHADEAANILREMPKEKAAELLQLLKKNKAKELKWLMHYKKDTAGSLMTTEFIRLPITFTAGQAVEHLRRFAREAEMIYYLYVTDVDEKLLGVLSLRELILAEPESSLGSLMHSKVIAVQVNDSNKKIAEIIHKYGLLAVPVLDAKGFLHGVVTVDDLLDLFMVDRTLKAAMSRYLNKRGLRRK